MTISLFSSHLPVLLIGVLQWLMPSLVPPTVRFGVRIPADRSAEPMIIRQRRRYRLGITMVTVAVVVGVVLGAGHPVAGALGIAAEPAGGAGLYLLARRRITAVKIRENWFGGLRQVAVADTALRTDPESFPRLWALPALALVVGTALTGLVRYPRMPARLVVRPAGGGRSAEYADKSIGSAFGIVGAQLLTTALLLVLAVAVLRAKAKLDAEDLRASVIRHRRLVAATSRAVLGMAACVNLTMLGAALTTWDLLSLPGPAVVAWAVVPPLAGAIAVTVALARIGRAGTDRAGRDRRGTRSRRPPAAGRSRPAGRAGSGPRDPVNRDDDRLYRLGIFYYNPDDPAVLAPKRFGIGWTLNMARPVAWLVLLGGFLLVLLAPLVSGNVH